MGSGNVDTVKKDYYLKRDRFVNDPRYSNLDEKGRQAALNKFYNDVSKPFLVSEGLSEEAAENKREDFLNRMIGGEEVPEEVKKNEKNQNQGDSSTESGSSLQDGGVQDLSKFQLDKLQKDQGLSDQPNQTPEETIEQNKESLRVETIISEAEDKWVRDKYGELTVDNVDKAISNTDETIESYKSQSNSLKESGENLKEEWATLNKMTKASAVPGLDGKEELPPEIYEKAQIAHGELTEKTQELAEAQQNLLLEATLELNDKEKLLKRRYSLRAEKGGFVGATWNSILGGIGKMSSGATDYAIDAMVELMPSEMIGSMDKDEAKKQVKKDMLPNIREGLKEVAGSSGTTEEYVKEMRDGFFGGAWLGLAESGPAMISPMMSGMFFQVSDNVMSEMNNHPEMAGLNEWEKKAVAAPIATVGMLLERAGFRNLAKNKAVLNRIVASALKDAPEGAATNQMVKVLKGKTDDAISNYLAVGAGAFLAEFETGAAQEASEIGMKYAYNQIKEKDLFTGPDGVWDFTKRVLRAGAQEGVGGFIIGQAPAISVATKTHKMNKSTTDAQFASIENIVSDPEYVKSVREVLEVKVEKKEITKEEADEVISGVEQAAEVVGAIDPDLAVKKRKKAFDLLTEKAKNKSELEEYEVVSPDKIEKKKKINSDLSELTKPKEKPLAEKADEKEVSKPDVNHPKVTEIANNKKYNENVKQYEKAKIEGKSDKITIPDGSEIEGKYVLVDAKDVFPSHNEKTFGKTPGVPVNDKGQTLNDRDYESDKSAQQLMAKRATDFDARALQNTPVVNEAGVVESGNDRTMARRLSSETESDAKYMEALKSDPEKFGFTKEQVESIKTPMVVFERKGEPIYTTEQYSKYNQAQEKGKSVVERGVEIAKKVDPTTINKMASILQEVDKISDINKNPETLKGIRTALVDGKIISENEIPEIFNPQDNTLTKQGQDLLETVLVASVFEGDSDIIRKLDTPGVKQLRGKISGMSFGLINNKKFENFDITETIKEAVELQHNLAVNNQDLESFLKQEDLFGDKSEYSPESVIMLLTLTHGSLNDGKGGKGLRTMVKALNDFAVNYDQGTDMFGEGVNPQEVIDTFLDKQYGELTEEQKGTVKIAKERFVGRDTSQGSSTDGANETGNREDGGKKIEEAAKKVADKLRQAKFVQSMKDLENLQSNPVAGVFAGVWDGVIETVATTIEAGGTIAQAVADGIKHVQGTQWYKDLSQDGQIQAEKIIKNAISIELSGPKKTLSENEKSKIKGFSLRKGIPILGQLDDYWAERIYDPIEKGVEKFVADLSKNQTDWKRVVGKGLTAWFNGLPKSNQDIANKMKMTGAQSKAILTSVEMAEGLKEMVANNPDKAKRVHQVLDSELYSDLDAVTYEDLEQDEKDLYDALRKINDKTHETNYAMELIDKETYEKFKGKYIGRLYEMYEIPDNLGMPELSTKGLFTGMYKLRKEMDEWKQENRVEDPIYSTLKRWYQTQQNLAVQEYANIVASNPNHISEKELKGYTLLKGKRYGALDGKYVVDYITEDFQGFFYSNKLMTDAYEMLKTYDRWGPRQFYKKLHTVFSPTVQLGNFMSNFAFGFVSGIDPVSQLAMMPKAKEQMSTKGLVYQNLLDKGIIGSNLFKEDLTPANKTAESLKIGKKETAWWNKLDQAAQDMYQGSDDIHKVAAYMNFLKQGYTEDQSIQKVFEGFQNYATVGKIWDVASKTPIWGNPYVKFQADLMRITKNAVGKRPLQTAAFLSVVKLGTLAASLLSGEDDEDRDVRETRPFVPKIPMLFDDISLGYKFGNQEYNFARFLSPLYEYDKGDQSFIEKATGLTPFPFIEIEGSQMGSTSYSPEMSDVVFAPIIQAFIVDRDFRGKSVADPKATKYKSGGLGSTERILNRFNYIGRSMVPLFSNVEDLYLISEYGEDFYGRSKGYTEQLMSSFVKVRKFEDPDYIKTYEGTMKTEEFKLRRISNSIRDAKSSYKKSIKKANQKYKDNEISKENRDHRIALEAERYQSKFAEGMGEFVEIQEVLDGIAENYPTFVEKHNGEKSKFKKVKKPRLYKAPKPK